MSDRFSRGYVAPERRPYRPIEQEILPDPQKEELCRSLLDEFGVHDVRQHGYELTHACQVTPSHQDQATNPTGSINFSNLLYHCFGCGASGSILWWIATIRNCSVDEARGWLNGETGLGGNVMDLSMLMKFFDAMYKPKSHDEPIPVLSEKVLEPWNVIHPYLTDPKDEYGRGIPEDNVRALRLGYAPEYVISRNPDGTLNTAERIVIPHFWKGRLVGWQSRRLWDDGTSKYLSSPAFPKDQTIYNYEPKHAGATTVTESMLSVVSKMHLGHIEATFGASLTDMQVSLLSKHPVVILFMDNDDAGWNAVLGRDDVNRAGRVLRHHPGLAERLERTSVVLVVENPYAADPDEMTDEDYTALRDAAVPFSIWRPPSVLYCYTCKQVAHDGACEEVKTA